MRNPVIGNQPHGGEGDNRVDDKERKDRDKTQGEKIERTILINPLVDFLELVAEFILHPKAKAAPMLLAKDTTMVPVTSPNKAPPARVKTAAAGRARAVAVT